MGGPPNLYPRPSEQPEEGDSSHPGFDGTLASAKVPNSLGFEGFRVYGLGFVVWGLGFRVYGLGFVGWGFRVQGLWFSVRGLGFRV